MKILIIGGSSFVGRGIALAAHERGHDVTVFNRGTTPTDLPESITRLVGNRQTDLSALSSGTYDATIDAIAYQRRDVELLHEALGERAGYYLQISSISAYQDPADVNADESTPLLELGDTDPNAPVTGATYGILKAECERAATELFGTNIGIVRPTFVVGGHDKTFRFPYWVARIARGGRVAFPGPSTNALQWIDARDLGEFCVLLTEGRYAGAVHALGTSPATSFGETLSRIASHVAPEGTTLVDLVAVVEAAGYGVRPPEVEEIEDPDQLGRRWKISAVLTVPVLLKINSVFGIPAAATSEVPADITALAEARVAAKQGKDFARADAIRGELKSLGWLVEDTAKGPKLKRV